MTVPNSKRLPLVTGSDVLEYPLHLVPTCSCTLLEEPSELVDEAYKGLEIVSPTIPLLETDHPASDGSIAWTGPSTNCRTVVLEPGNTAAPFLNQSYREIVQRPLVWVARSGSSSGDARRGTKPDSGSCGFRVRRWQ